MKRKSLLPLFIAVAGFTVGCDKAETTAQQIDKVQAKAAEAAQDMEDYTFVQKAEFTAKMEGQLAEINKDLDLLAAKIEKSGTAVKAETGPKLDSLRAQAAKLDTQLKEARNATESTWESVKAGTKNAYEALKEGFQESRQWVSEKIAP